MKYMVFAPKSSLELLLKKPIEGIIIGVQGFTQRSDALYDSSELTDYVARIKAAKKAVWINLNALFHEPDLKKLKSLLSNIQTLDIDGLLFSDLAVFTLAQELKLKNKLIYYPETYLTHQNDFIFWQKQGIKSGVLSRELSLKSIETIAEKTDIPLSLLGHGYVNMFHSKRRLLKTFFDYTKKEADPHKKTYTIKEDLREEMHPIFQDAFGTHIFRDKPLSSFNVFNQLSPIISYFLIDSLFFDQDRLLSIVDDYLALSNGRVVDLKRYTDHDEGFYFKKLNYHQAKEGPKDED